MANYCVYHGGDGTSGAVAGSVPTAGEWATAYQSLSACLTAINGGAAHTIFVAHDHNAAYGAGTTLFGAPTSGIHNILCIDRTNTTTATLTTGGTEYTNGNFSLTVGQALYVYGMTFTAGVGTSTSSANVSVNANTATDLTSAFEKCTFKTNTTTATVVNLNSILNYGALCHVRNCTFEFTNSSQAIRNANAGYGFKLVNCALTGTAPTTAFNLQGNASVVEINGSDFSAATNLMNIGGDDVAQSFKFVNCKIPSSVTTGTHVGIGALTLELHACSSTDHNYDYYFQDGSGVVQDSQSIYLTTGGSQIKDVDGSLVPYSLEANPSTYASKAFPLYTPWVSKFVGSTGSKTISLKVAYDSATALLDTECWIEVEYYGNASTPQSTVTCSAPLVSGTNSRDILAAGSNLTDTSEAWTGTSGWSNKKTATLSKTVTINQQGYVRCRIATAKDQTIYVDQVIGVA